MFYHHFSFSLQMTKPEGGQVFEKKINCRFDVNGDGAFKTTNEQSQGSVGGSAGADDAVGAFKSSTDAPNACVCPVSGYVRTSVIISLIVIFLAIVLIYSKLGDEAKAILKKVDVSGVVSGAIGAHGRGPN